MVGIRHSGGEHALLSQFVEQRLRFIISQWSHFGGLNLNVSVDFFARKPSVLKGKTFEMSSARDALDQVQKVLGSLAREDSEATER